MKKDSNIKIKLVFVNGSDFRLTEGLYAYCNRFQKKNEYVRCVCSGEGYGSYIKLFESLLNRKPIKSGNMKLVIVTNAIHLLNYLGVDGDDEDNSVGDEFYLFSAPGENMRLVSIHDVYPLPITPDMNMVELYTSIFKRSRYNCTERMDII